MSIENQSAVHVGVLELDLHFINACLLRIDPDMECLSAGLSLADSSRKHSGVLQRGSSVLQLRPVRSVRIYNTVYGELDSYCRCDASGSWPHCPHVGRDEYEAAELEAVVRSSRVT